MLPNANKLHTSFSPTFVEEAAAIAQFRAAADISSGLRDSAARRTTNYTAQFTTQEVVLHMRVTVFAESAK